MSPVPEPLEENREYSPLPRIDAGGRYREVQRLPLFSLSTAPHRPYRVRDWEQIEDETDVQTILKRIKAARRFDVYQRVELYECVYPGYPGDVDFYARHGCEGRVLFLGIGAGRIFGHIARQNPMAVGIDNSAEMVSVFRERFPDIRDDQILLGDVSHIELPAATFDKVLAPYSFLQVISQEQLSLLLPRLQRAMRPGALLIADVFSPYLIPFRKSGLEANVFDIAAGTRAGIYIAYDHERQHMCEMALFEESGTATVLEMHLEYYFPREICQAFCKAGLSRPKITGDYDGCIFDPIHSDLMVLESTCSR